MELAIKLTYKVGDIALIKQSYSRLADAIQQELAKPELTPADRINLVEKIEYLYSRLRLPEFSTDQELISKISLTVRIGCDDVLSRTEMLINSGIDYHVIVSNYCRLLTNLAQNPHTQNNLLLNSLLRANKTLILVIMATLYNLPLRAVLANTLDKGNNEVTLDFIRRIHTATDVKQVASHIENYLRELGLLGRAWNRNLVTTLEQINRQLAGIPVASATPKEPVDAKTETATSSTTAAAASGSRELAIAAAPPPTYLSVDEPASAALPAASASASVAAAPVPSAPPLEKPEKNRIVELLNKLATFKDPHALDDIEEKLKCPISLHIMKDPVIAADGYCYDRASIQDHININTKKGIIPVSPKELTPLANNFLVPAKEKCCDIIECLEKLIKTKETIAASQQMRLAPDAGNPVLTRTETSNLPQQWPKVPSTVPDETPAPVPAAVAKEPTSSLTEQWPMVPIAVPGASVPVPAAIAKEPPHHTP